MEISKGDGDREEDDIARVSKEQTHEFNYLGEHEHENELSPECVFLAFGIPVGSCAPDRVEKERIEQEGE